jgi:predicted O-methyltransferase YrrM
MAALQGPPEKYGYLDAILREFASSRVREPIDVLEIGSWVGASTVTWALALQDLGREGRITCIDLWNPYIDLEIDTESHYLEMDRAARTGDAFKLFLHNINSCGIAHMIEYVVGDSRDILSTFTPETFDIIYIDGFHVYHAMRTDIQSAKSLVKQQGIMCGDDLELQRPEVDPERHAPLVSCGNDYCLDVRSGKYYHPGVTEAVGLEFEDLTAHQGIWLVQKSGNSWVPFPVDETRGKVPHPIPKEVATSVKAVGQTHYYNLLQGGEKFLAVAKSLGPTNLFEETLGERELKPIILVGETLGELEARVKIFESRDCSIIGGAAGH